MNPTPLPEGLAAPMHLLPPWLPMLLAWAMLTALLAGIFGLWLWRHLRRAQPQSSPAPPAPTPPASRSLAERITALSRRFLELGRPREGCHALSAELKTHLEGRTGMAIEEMTTDEIRRRLASRQIGEFFVDLREQQYGRREPRGKDLQRLSRRALDLFADGRRYKLRDGN